MSLQRMINIAKRVEFLRLGFSKLSPDLAINGASTDVPWKLFVSADIERFLHLNGVLHD
jgi:hypothetical protein